MTDSAIHPRGTTAWLVVEHKRLSEEVERLSRLLNPAWPRLNEGLNNGALCNEIRDVLMSAGAAATKEHCPHRLAADLPPHLPCDTGDFSRDGGK